MRGEVALIREQGQDFAVLVVKNSVISNAQARDEMAEFGFREFGVRTALLSEDGRTWGDKDIVNWLEGVFLEQLPWREFSMA
ncbi:MAG: hypothetical protein JJE35_03925 [Thermoleophilia bacterium]|nr:hypothetical protein [Thermoleophilia bacterium]